MRLYKISENGEFIEIYKLEFQDDEIYVIDDIEENMVYIWAGVKSSEKKREYGAEFARQIEREQSGKVRILIMKQNREYGSFLAMMADLKKGIIPGKDVERRAEMKLNIPAKPQEKEVELKSKIVRDKSEYQILAWLEQQKLHRKPVSQITGEIHGEKPTDFKFQIQEAAYFISLKNFSYDELCWFLAEKIERISFGMPSLKDIREKAEQIFNSSITYDELCWLNGEIDILISKGLIEKGKIGFK
jgi:hypothetical protein